MISVVITAYNVEQYIGKTLQSIIGQTYRDLDIIVINDASTDNTESVIKNVMESDTRVRIVSNVLNKGAGMSRAIGVAEAHGDYIIFVDGDDYIADDYIEALAAEAERTDADIVSGGVTLCYQDGRMVEDKREGGILEGDEKILKGWDNRICYVCTKIIRKSIFDKVPYCKRRYIEDTPFIVPAMWYANKIAVIEHCGYYYQERATSLTHTSDFFKNLVFKALCWCDIIEFFEQNDPDMLKKKNIFGYLCSTIDIINKNPIFPEQIERYKDEWCELTRRIFNRIQITQINYKKKI